MGQRHLEQKSKDYHIKARNRDEDRLAIGAQNKGEPKGKCKENAENNSERGDRIRWTKKFQCSFGESMHLQAWPEGQGLLVHLLRIRMLMEKVAMTEVLRTHQNFLVKVSQPKLTDYLVQTARKEVVKGEAHVIFGMLSNVQNSKLQADTDFGVKRACKQTAKLADEKGHSATIAPSHIPPNDERQMQLREIQSDDKYVLKREKLRPTLGVIQIRSQNQRNANAPTFDERSIEWTLSMEGKHGQQLRSSRFVF